jgi:hypothetical protein
MRGFDTMPRPKTSIAEPAASAAEMTAGSSFGMFARPAAPLGFRRPRTIQHRGFLEIPPGVPNPAGRPPLPRGGLCVVITDTAIDFRLVCRPVNLILAQDSWRCARGRGQADVDVPMWNDPGLHAFYFAPTRR